jgi:plastocyanin
MVALRQKHRHKSVWVLSALLGLLVTRPVTCVICVHLAQAAPTATEGTRVSIAAFAFTPAEVVIAPGESVTWTNDDGAPHGLAFQDGAPGTDLLLPGARFRRQFERPGTYEYKCAIHPYMAGRVVVRAP